jgi:catechol 2,3-dioxygenase-like lactoylglutathione lyase family enzyme
VTRFVEIALFTDVVDATRAFYERLLDARPEAFWPGGALFAAGEVKLLVHERGAAAEDCPPKEDHIALGVADLDRVCAALHADGMSLLVEPRDFPWGRSAYLRDPDGRLVELSESASAP